MKGKKIQRKAGLFLLLVFLVLDFGCLFRGKPKNDPFYEVFFEKTRLIMTDEEIEIYKSLPRDKDREEFIEEFWRIRDPVPWTEENENKIEFEQRINYANLWFGPLNPYRGRDVPVDMDRYRGWNTDRGRAFIILGPPDELYFDGERILGDRWVSRPDGKSWELWVYYRFQISLYFEKTKTDRWITSYSSDVWEAMEEAKLNMIGTEYQDDVERSIRFKARFEEDRLILKVPAHLLIYEMEGERLRAEVNLRMNVYVNDRKIETVKDILTWEASEEDLLETKDIVFEVPYSVSEQGNYLFDIVLEDLKSLSFSRHRALVKHKEE